MDKNEIKGGKKVFKYFHSRVVHDPSKPAETVETRRNRRNRRNFLSYQAQEMRQREDDAEAKKQQLRLERLAEIEKSRHVECSRWETQK